MLKIPHYLVLSPLFLAVVACTDSGLNKNAVAQKRNENLDRFGAFQDWPERAQMRRVGNSFIEEVMHVEQDNDGNTWILRRSTSNSIGFSAVFIEKYDHLGALIFCLKEAPNTHFNAFTIHPSGEVTVAETRKIETSEEYGRIFHIWFKRLTNDGSLITEAPLQDPGSEKERLYYKFDWDKENSDIIGIETIQYAIDPGNKERRFYNNSEMLLSVGEEALFLAFTYGIKLYRLKKDLQIVWNKLVMPLHSFMFSGYLGARLAVDENGNAYVALDTNSKDLEAWRVHFQRNIPQDASRGSFLILGFNRSGDFQDAQIFKQDNSVKIAGFSVKNEVITLGGVMYVRGKPMEPNNTQERDLVFLKANMKTGELYTHKIIDLQRDDDSNDFKIDKNGNGIFVGSNNFVQVDTWSVVEYGQGYVLTVDKDGNKLDYIPLPGPRNTEINSFDFLKTAEGHSGIVFGGRYDAPITHTGDQDKSLNYQKGLFGICSNMP